MTPARWREVKAALDRLNALGMAERAAALAELRALDAELAGEAESLLDARPADSFLESPAAIPPPVEPGMRVGSYEVLNLLGRGGMGEVWRARDTTLHRDVALKVLASDVAHDPARLARLRKEAQMLASLDHPCIATIYGFEAFGPTPALVLELVQGQTLAALLSRGALPLHDGLRVARQIAEALEAAHERGIVHRDLKPGNVMLRPDGTVKVLDFGLATALGPEYSDAATTLTLNLTQPGTILGTPAYMAPEQARGETVDHRADIWAFGCVLYEMLTGRSAFGAPTVTESLANVLGGNVDFNHLPDATPPSIRRLVRRCLDPSLRNRLQHIGDARADVVDALADDWGGEVAPGSARHHPAGAPSARPRARYLSGVLVVAGLVVVVAGGFLFLRSRDRAALQGSELSLPQGIRLTTTGNATTPAISPDGKAVAYVERSHDGDSLVIRQTTATGRIISLVRPGPPILAVTITPDGQFVDYLTLESAGHNLRRVPSFGGPSRKLLEGVDSALAWSPDKSRFAFLRLGPGSDRTSLMLADADGNNVRPLSSQVVSENRGRKFSVLQLVRERGPARPAWSRDGATIAVAGIRYPDRAGLVMFVAVSNGDVEEVVVRQGSGGAWVDDATLLWSMAAAPEPQLYSVSYPSGRFFRLTTDLSGYGSVSVSEQRDTFVAAQVDREGEIWIRDRSGTESTLGTSAAPPVAGLFAHLAWAGDWLLYPARPVNQRGIWAANVVNPRDDLEEWVRNASEPSASADGSVVIYSAPGSDPAHPNTLWKVARDGRNPTPVATNAYHLVIHPTGQHAVFVRPAVDGPQTPWLVALAGGTPQEIAHVDARNPDISADGRWLAFASKQIGDDGVRRDVIGYCELQNCSPVFLRAPGLPSSATPVRWTPDGTGVAYVNAAGPENIWIQPLQGTARQLTRFTNGRTIKGFAWSPDGSKMAALLEKSRTDIVLFRGSLTRRGAQTP